MTSKDAIELVASPVFFAGFWGVCVCVCVCVPVPVSVQSCYLLDFCFAGF